MARPTSLAQSTHKASAPYLTRAHTPLHTHTLTPLLRSSVSLHGVDSAALEHGALHRPHRRRDGVVLPTALQRPPKAAHVCRADSVWTESFPFTPHSICPVFAENRAVFRFANKPTNFECTFSLSSVDCWPIFRFFAKTKSKRIYSTCTHER